MTRFIRPVQMALYISVLLIIATVLPSCTHVSGQAPMAVTAEGRNTVDLSGSGWSLWRDDKATWETDELFLPPVDLKRVPATQPTGGWQTLESPNVMPVSVPGTAEEYLGNGTGPSTEVKGVTWWTRKLSIPALTPGRKIHLQFDSVRMRAEVYVNRKLVAYDLIGNTPFEADITDAVQPGHDAQLAVRITNPGGNFDWRDVDSFKWGKYNIPLSHAFGGISGKVRLVVTDPIYVADVYIQNRPEVTKVNIVATVQNTTAAAASRDVEISAGGFHQVLKDVKLSPGENSVKCEASDPDAKVWDLQHPNLYTCKVTLSNGSAKTDGVEQTFGFRWFAPDGVGTDAMLRLNGKRIVLRTAISWGFWPINGLFPTPELAEKQIRAAQAYGLNMLNFHRAIGNPIVLQKADELGLLYFEEPGGYVSGEGDPFAQAICREKLLRMVKRDRSHPSLVIYNMINEQHDKFDAKEPAIFQVHRADLQLAHAVDPSRQMLYTSAWAGRKSVDDPAKMHMRPYDSTVHMTGWWDFHRAGGPDSWNQSFYKSPTEHYGATTNPAEIVYWGEEGAVSSPPRLGLIKQALDHAPHLGWDGQIYLDWYKAFDDFLTAKNLRSTFGSVDDFCKALGVVALDHQGRKIEDTRIANMNDGYAINGWEAEIIENHSGVVDCFRNPKSDPSYIANRNRPFCVAVKVRRQIVEPGDSVVVDFYVLNETDQKGPRTLAVSAISPDGKSAFSQQFPVDLKGGDIFSQLAAQGVSIPVGNVPGKFAITAKLLDNAGVEKTDGQDEILVVDWRSAKLTGNGAVYESDNKVSDFLKTQKALAVPAYADALPKLDWAVVARGPINETVPITSDHLTSPDGSQPGLSATFFKGTDLKEEIYRRQDKQVDFKWNAGSNPDTHVPLTENYSIRWEGQVKPPVTGDYTFSTTSDDGARLWVDGNLIIDAWETGKNTNKTGKAMLSAGKPVSIKLEYYQELQGAEVHLSWQVPEATHVDLASLFNRARNDGTVLIFLDRADAWSATLKQYAGATTNGSFKLGGAWLGGQFFAKSHPLLKDLPVDQAMGWPYQAVIDGSRMALNLEGDELVAGGYQTYPMHLGTAVGIVPCGKGKLVLSTLNIAAKLSSTDSSAAVAKKLLCNYVEFAHLAGS